MKIYQVINSSGNPAFYDEVINRNALFLTKKGAEEYIHFLQTECDLEDKEFTVINFTDLITVLEYMQSEDPNGSYLDDMEDLPSMEYAKETILSWEDEHEAEIPNHIMNIINKY